MSRLPLFPLNVVLFPGMLLPLHIFEERYKAMVNRCMEEKQPFGVVLEEPGAGGHAAPPFREIGTMAHITDADRLEEGRMNIAVLGRQRFRVRSVARWQPYLVAEVDLYPLEAETPHQRQMIHHVLAKDVHRLLTIYTELLLQSTRSKVNFVHMPSSPTTLAFLTGIVLQIPLPEKQRLLEMPSAYAMLRQEARLLRRENALLAYMLRTQEEEEEDTWPPLPNPSLN